jgi:hypothetical protein
MCLDIERLWSYDCLQLRMYGLLKQLCNKRINKLPDINLMSRFIKLPLIYIDL